MGKEGEVNLILCAKNKNLVDGMHVEHDLLYWLCREFGGQQALTGKQNWHPYIFVTPIVAVIIKLQPRECSPSFG